MIVAMMQPTFLPWAGYFALIHACDTFVLLDDFQFQRRSFHHRNRLFLSGDSIGWVTVPVTHAKSDTRPLLTEVRPVLDERFQRKFTRLLEQNYGSTPGYETVMESIGPLLERHDGRSLADLNISLIQSLAALLDISSDWRRSSELGVEGKRSERMAGLLRRIGASTYLAAAGSEAYMRADGVFPLPEVRTCFQRYVPADYPQRQADSFVPYLSVLDMLFQVGPEQARSCVVEGDRGAAEWQFDGVG